MKKLTVALLSGGISSEREVSLNSGNQVFEVLDKEKYDVIRYDPKTDLQQPNVDAVRAGGVNLKRHIENVKKFGITPTIAINHFHLDTDEEIAVIQEMAAQYGADAIVCRHWADGSAGAQELAQIVSAKADAGAPDFDHLYSSDLPLAKKIETIGKEIYRASTVTMLPAVKKQLKSWEEMGYGQFPVCMAKTQYSFSTDPTKLGAPEGHEVHIREVRLSAGAGFVVAIAGDIMTMPGLPRVPSAEAIHLDDNGQIEGLF